MQNLCIKHKTKIAQPTPAHFKKKLWTWLLYKPSQTTYLKMLIISGHGNTSIAYIAKQPAKHKSNTILCRQSFSWNADYNNESLVTLILLCYLLFLTKVREIPERCYCMHTVNHHSFRTESVVYRYGEKSLQCAHGQRNWQTK